MALPLEAELLAERQAVVATMRSLTPEELDSAPTLCSEWAPRDVLAHLMGADTGLLTYARNLPDIDAGNRAIVEAARDQPRDRLLRRADHWATRLAPHVRVAAWFWLQDTTTHHQDVLRPLGRTRDLPPTGRSAVLRAGYELGALRLLHHRIEPTDGADLGVIGRARGRADGPGHTVRGTAEALGLWLAGREGLEDELEFV